MIETKYRNFNIERIKRSMSTGKAALLYTSLISFLILVAIISWSVNRFINDTLSISFPDSEDLAQDNQTKIEVFVKKGDTLSKILHAQEIPNIEIQSIINAIKTLKSPLTLQLGQKITFDYDLSVKEDDNEELVNEVATLKRLAISLDRVRTIEIIRNGPKFVVHQLEIPLKKTLVKSSAVVKNSFMGAARSLGISNSNVVELVNI